MLVYEIDSHFSLKDSHLSHRPQVLVYEVDLHFSLKDWHLTLLAIKQARTLPRQVILTTAIQLATCPRNGSSPPTPCSSGSRGGGGDHPPPWTCPDTENLCKVCVTGTDHPPPPLECGWRHTGNAQGGGGACECLHPPFRKSCIRACLVNESRCSATSWQWGESE